MRVGGERLNIADEVLVLSISTDVDQGELKYLESESVSIREFVHLSFEYCSSHSHLLVESKQVVYRERRSSSSPFSSAEQNVPLSNRPRRAVNAQLYCVVHRNVVPRNILSAEVANRVRKIRWRDTTDPHSSAVAKKFRCECRSCRIAKCIIFLDASIQVDVSQ